MPKPHPEHWLTKQEVADAAGVSLSTVNRAIRAGQLQAAKTNPHGAVRIRWAWVLEWLKPQNLLLALLLDDRVQAVVTALVTVVGVAALCNCYVHVCFPGHLR